MYIYNYIYNCTSLYMIDRTKSYKIHACHSLISALINISMPRSQVQPAWFFPLHLGLSATKHRIYRIVTGLEHGGFHKWAYPNSWMVYYGKSYEIGWFRDIYITILGNLHMSFQRSPYFDGKLNWYQLAAHLLGNPAAQIHGIIICHMHLHPGK